MYPKIYKMKNLTVVFLLLLITSIANSQVINLEMNAGYGFYNLDDIKTLQTTMLSAVSLPGVKAVETFPNNLYYSFSVNHLINRKHRIGIEFSYFTTGGRNHLSDYSGEYKVDMLLNGYQIGPKFQDYILIIDEFKIGLQLAGGIIFSNLEMDEILTINEEEMSSDQMKLNSTGWFVEPSLRISYNIFDKLNINISGGYNFNEKGELEMNGEKTILSANWSGIRLLAGIDYTLNFATK